MNRHAGQERDQQFTAKRPLLARLARLAGFAATGISRRV
jgi:hypothetical protein